MSLYLQLWNVSAYLLWLSVDLYKWNGQIYNPILPVLKKLVKSPIFTKLLEKGRHIFDSLCSVYAVAQKQDIGNCLLEICQKLHKVV